MFDHSLEDPSPRLASELQLLLSRSFLPEPFARSNLETLHPPDPEKQPHIKHYLTYPGLLFLGVLEAAEVSYMRISGKLGFYWFEISVLAFAVNPCMEPKGHWLGLPFNSKAPPGTCVRLQHQQVLAGWNAR